MNESCPTYNCRTIFDHRQWIMSHRCMSHVPYMNQSCPIYECFMSHIWISHVLCPTYFCRSIFDHSQKSRATEMYEACPTYEYVGTNRVWITRHDWFTCMSHVFEMYVSSYMYESCFLTCISHVSCVNPSRLATHIPLPIHIRSLSTRTSRFCHVTPSVLCVTWVIHIWDITHLYVGRDSFISGTWLIRAWDVTQSYVGCD